MDAAAFIKVMGFYGKLTPSYTKIGYYGRRLTWGLPKPFDFSGQRWLVTGANAGIGKAIMHAAAKAGATVLAVARNRDRLAEAIAELPDRYAMRIVPIIADMSLQSGTETLLEELAASGSKIDVLINNVGVLLNEHSLTSEGRETSFATNVLSHFQLTEGMLNGDLLAPTATIVNMSSGGMYGAPLGIKGLNTVDASAYQGKMAYNFAKRAQVALTVYWNEKYADRGIRAYVTHPGWARTPGVKSGLPVFWKIQYLLLRSGLQGGDTALWLAATRPEIGEEEAIWFDRKARPTHMFERSREPQCTIEELVAYLNKELDSAPAAADAVK